MTQTPMTQAPMTQAPMTQAPMTQAPMAFQSLRPSRKEETRAPALPAAPLPLALQQIDALTEQHAADYHALAAEMRAMSEAIEAIKRAHLPALRERVTRAKASRVRLSAAIAANADEFARPRTRQLHGFKIGMRKLEGRLGFVDEQKAVELVRRHFPQDFAVLVRTEYSIVKDAAVNLAASELKRIGGHIGDAVDQVVIAATAGETAKLVDALLKEPALA